MMKLQFFSYKICVLASQLSPNTIIPTLSPLSKIQAASIIRCIIAVGTAITVQIAFETCAS